MAFPPHQVNSGNGDAKSLLRALWNNGASLNAAFQGGYFNATYGEPDFKYTDAEGWAPRINYYGTTPGIPFNSANKSGYGGSISNQAETANGVATIRRKGVGVDTSTINATPNVNQLRNLQSGEMYTTGYGTTGNPKDYFYLTTRCLSDSTWHCTWYAKSFQYAEMQVHIFGVADATGWGSFGYNFTGQVGVDAGSSTITSPSTGGTRYYKTITLGQNYTKYEMTFTFNGDANIVGIMMRYDCNTGGSFFAPKDVNVDRFTLHPINVSLSTSQGGAESDDALDDTAWLTY